MKRHFFPLKIQNKETREKQQNLCVNVNAS